MTTTPQDSRIALSSPRLRVVFGDPERSETWEAIEVQTIGRDLQDAEELLARNGLGKLVDVPIAASAAAAYYALRRTGRRSGDWAKFQSEYLDISSIGDVDVADPTQPGHANGHASP
jgi:hypothetical protein